MGQDMGKAKSKCEEHTQVCSCCDHEDETRVLSETTRKETSEQRIMKFDHNEHLPRIST